MDYKRTIEDWMQYFSKLKKKLPDFTLFLKQFGGSLDKLPDKFGKTTIEVKNLSDALAQSMKKRELVHSAIDILKASDDASINEAWKELEKYDAARKKIEADAQAIIEDKNKPDYEKKNAAIKMEEDIQALNITTLKKTEIWTNLFASIDKLSKKSIKSQIADIDSLLKYIKTNKAEGSIPAGFSEEDVVRINEIAEGYAAGTDAAKNFVKETETASAGLKKALNELNSKKHFAKIIEGFKSLKGAAAGSKGEIEAVGNILEGFKGLGSAFTEVGKAMDEAGIKAGNTVKMIGTVITQTVSMAGTGASVGGGWGAIIGAVTGLVTSLIPALKGTSELSEETKHYYNSLIKITDELINKQLELIKSSSNAATAVAADNAKAMLDYQKLTKEDYILEYMNKSSGSSHSQRHNTTHRLKIFFHDNSNMKETLGSGKSLALKTWHQNDLYNTYKQGKWEIDPSKFFLDMEKLEEAGIDPLLFLKDINKAITSLNADQINVLKEHGMGIWAQLDDETQNYLDSIVAYDEKIKEIDRITRESNTGTTFDKLLTDLNKLVAQADLAIEDIGKSFEGHMSNAILNTIKKNYLSKELEEWYQEFSDRMAEGTLSPEDAENLRKQYEDIVNESNKQYKAAMKAAGLDIPTASDNPTQTRSSIAQGIASMSQDTASELNGNFYALFMTVDGIHQIMKNRQEQEENQKEYTLPTLQEMLVVSRSSNTYLLDIRNNTSHLIAIDSNIEYMNNNILSIRNEGVKIRS